MRKLFFLFLVFFTTNSSFCLEFKNPFKKSPVIQKEKIPQTKQEWEEKAQNIPLEDRKLDPYKDPESDKKTIYNTPHFVFELYNNPPGMRKLDISDIKKNLYSYPYIVSDNKCHYVAYPRYYFSPDINQISSEFFVEKLDTTKTKVRRMLDYNHNQKTRNSIIVSGKKEHYPNLFSGLSLVDWSKDGKKLLIQEKVGSTINGIYKTYLYVHFMENEITQGYTIKLDNLDNAIKKYFLHYQNVQIVKYRYDIEPLGFSQDNDNIIIAFVYVYDKNMNKIFLGAWGYNISNNEIILLSTTQTQFPISANGLILIKSVD